MRMATGILGILLVCGAPWGAVAHAQPSTNPITVVTEEYPPYNYQGADNQIAGLSTEVVREALKRARIEYRINLYPWARTYRMAQEQPNVLIYSIARNEQREKLFQWVDVIAQNNAYIYRLKTRPEVKAQHLDELKRFRIGAVRDDYRAQYLAKHAIPLDLAVEDAANAHKLASARIDMFVIDEIAQVALYKREGLDPASVEKVMALPELSSGLYMAFSLKTDSTLVERCRAALREMHRDGTMEKIKARYL